MDQNPEGLMEVRVQLATFTKQVKDGHTVVHHARIVTYVDESATEPHFIAFSKFYRTPIVVYTFE